MTLNDYFKRDEERGLWSMESLTLMYMLFTTILIGFYWEGLAAPMDMLLTRLWMLVAMAAVYGFYRWYPCRALRILRVIPPLLALIHLSEPAGLRRRAWGGV
ncbi:MAG: hypothetical protein K2H04_00870, partial [Bacteroidaceae bacterium]|nr:hypothetical protein [Bacteroidaceae bacterium]